MKYSFIFSLLTITSLFTFNAAAQRSFHDNRPNMATIEDEFAYVAPTHWADPGIDDPDTLDAYGVKILHKEANKTKIWHASIYSDNYKHLWIGYKVGGDEPPKCPPGLSCPDWKELRMLEEKYNKVYYEKYDAILGLFKPKKIAYHVIVLHDSLQPLYTGKHPKIDVYVRVFNEKNETQKFFGKTKFDYQKLKDLGLDNKLIEDLKLLHEGTIHYPGGD